MTHDLEHTVVGSVLAGVTADRCGQCGACDRTVVLVAMGNREASDMGMTERNNNAPTQPVGGPFAWVDRHIETDIANFEAASRAKSA